MQTYLKTRPVWMQLLMFLGMVFGMMFIALAVGSPLILKLTGLNVYQVQDSKNWDLSNPNFLTYIRAMILLQFLFLFTIPSILFSFFSDKKPVQYLGLKLPSSAVYWLWGVLLILAAYPFVEYIGLVNQKLAAASGGEGWVKEMEEEATRQIAVMMRERTTINLVLNLVFVALFAGIGEELFFRGILQRMFIRATGNPWAGIIIAAVVFSAIHFQFYGFFPRLFLGVLLGAIFWFSGSLWVSILVHFLYDALVIVMIHFNPQMLDNTEATIIKANPMVLLTGAMVSLAITFVILYQMQKKSVASFEAIYSDDFPSEKDDFSF